ncbi:MAG TPA: hypothetical protein VHT30_06380, partial [Acidimicrobiales bacterium]|nr:hypothetical protein [Acidimicrobiales bacterium]
MFKFGGRSISPVVLIGGVVVLLAVTLAFAVPALRGGPTRRSSHVAATPIVTTPTATVSPSDTPTPTPTVTASASVEPGPAQGALGPPPAGDPVPSSSTIVYLNGPPTVQVYSAPDAGKRASSLPGHNSI